MAYFYVKNSLGTRTTGGGLTKQTGDFTTLGAANVYATIEAAIADGAGEGDHILVSDLHQYDKATGNLTYEGEYITASATATPGVLTIVSVSDANCDQYAKATAYQEATVANPSYIYFGGRIVLVGVWLRGQRSLRATYDNSYIHGRDCTLEAETTSQGTIIENTSDAVGIVFDRCSLLAPAPPNSMTLMDVNGGTVKLINCTTNADDRGFYMASLGGNITAIGCDFSQMTTRLIDINSYDPFHVTLIGCKLNDSMTEPLGSNYEPFVPNSSFTMARCWHVSTPTEAEYQYYYRDAEGKTESNTTIYRDETAAFTSGQKISFKVDTRTSAYREKGHVLRLPAKRENLDINPTIRIRFATTDTIFFEDVTATVIYEDAVNQEVLNIASTVPVSGLEGDTELSADISSTWKDSGGAADLTGYNEYYLDVDTSGDPGVECIPIVELNFGLASTAFYVDPFIEAV